MINSTYIDIVKANIAYWLQCTADLTETNLHPLAKEFPNLLRAVRQGLVLPETKTAHLAQLVKQSFLLIETHGLWQPWLPLLAQTLSQSVQQRTLLHFELLSQKGHLLRLNWEIDAAIEVHRHAKSIAEGLDNKLSLGYAHYYLSEDYRYQQRYEEAEKYGNVALILFRKVGEDADSGIAAVLNTLGLVAWEQQDEMSLRLAETRLQEALFYSKRTNPPRLIARTCISLALVLQEQARFEESLEKYKYAEKLLKPTGSELDKSKLYNCLGTLYDAWGKLQKAETAFKMADTEILQLSGDIYTRAALVQNLGNVILKQGRIHEAEQFLRRSVNLWQEIGHSFWYANAMCTLGECLVAQKRFREAEGFLEKAVNVTETLPDTPMRRVLSDQIYQLKISY